MKFSVVIPTLNASAVLGRCLQSLVCQSFQDFEVLVEDGGSTDVTADVVRVYRDELGDRLVLDSQRDGGVYCGMNRGVARAAGEWLYFLGADDRVCDGVLAAVAEFVGRAGSDVDLVYGNVAIGGGLCGGVFDLDTLLFERNIPHQGVFYRRDLFARVGWYNVRYPLWADWDFNVRCFMNPSLVSRSMPIIVADFAPGGIGSGVDWELAKWLPGAAKIAVLNSRVRKR